MCAAGEYVFTPPAEVETSAGRGAAPVSWGPHVVAQLCLTVCDLMGCSTPGFPVLQYLPEFAQAHVH